VICGARAILESKRARNKAQTCAVLALQTALLFSKCARRCEESAIRIAIRAKVNEVCVVSQRQQRRSLADDVPI
jgi:hypothetical protein